MDESEKKSLFIAIVGKIGYKITDDANDQIKHQQYEYSIDRIINSI